MTPEERAAKLAAEILRECDRHDAETIIAAAIREAVKAEREACAKVAETLKPLSVTAPSIQRRHGDKIAAAVRERPL